MKKRRLTVLNLAAGIFIIGCIVYTLINYRVLFSGEGWGIVAIAGLAGVGIVMLAVDVILRQLFRSRLIVNLIGALFVIAAAIFILRPWR